MNIRYAIVNEFRNMQVRLISIKGKSLLVVVKYQMSDRS